MDKMKNQNQRLTFAISALAFFLLFALMLQLVLGTYLGRYSPHSFLLYAPTDMPGDISGSCRDHHWGVHFFGDFQSVYCKAITRAPYQEPSPGSYFPAAYLLMMPLQVFGKHYWLMFASWTLMGVVLLVVSVHRLLRFSKANGWFTSSTLCIICWPLIAALDRGNIQIHVVALILLGFATKDEKADFLSPIALGIAAGFKGYPLFFSVMYMKKREWSKLAVCWCTFAILNIGAMVFIRGGFYSNMSIFIQQIRSFSGTASGTFDSYSGNFLSGNASLKALFTSFEQLGFWNLKQIGMFGLSNYKMIVIAVVLVILGSITWLNLSVNRLVYVLVTAPLLLIGLTAQYSLLVLLAPICVWCVDFLNDTSDKIGVVLLIAVAMIMAPISIPLGSSNIDPQTGVAIYTSVSVGSLLRPLLMALIIGTVVIEGIINRRRRNKGPLI